MVRHPHPEPFTKRQPGDGHCLGRLKVRRGADQAIGAEPAQHRDRGFGYDEQISRLLQRRIGVRGLLR